MKNRIEIYSKDENVLVQVDRHYHIREVLAYVPALDSWHEINSDRLQTQAEKLVQDHIEENQIQIDDSCDDFAPNLKFIRL